MLEGRIKFQKILSAVNQLPQPDTWKEFEESGEDNFKEKKASGVEKYNSVELKLSEQVLFTLQIYILIKTRVWKRRKLANVLIYVTWSVYSEVLVRESSSEIDPAAVGPSTSKLRNSIHWVWSEKVSKYKFVVEYKNFTMHCTNNKSEKFCAL